MKRAKVGDLIVYDQQGGFGIGTVYEESFFGSVFVDTQGFGGWYKDGKNLWFVYNENYEILERNFMEVKP